MSNYEYGQKVKIARKVTAEAGWDDVWVDGMDAYVGRIGSVIMTSVHGVHVGFPDLPGGWDFPPSSLEIVKE